MSGATTGAQPASGRIAGGEPLRTRATFQFLELPGHPRRQGEQVLGRLAIGLHATSWRAWHTCCIDPLMVGGMGRGHESTWTTPPSGRHRARARTGTPPPPAAPASPPACPPPRPWATARLVHRPRDPQRRVVPADAGLAAPGCTSAVQKYSISVTSARAQNPRANDAGAQNRTGSSSEPSTVTTCPSVGEPGRMSTATMNARPRTTRMSLAWGGSHWKCRPRMTPREDRDWLTWTNDVGRPPDPAPRRHRPGGPR